MDFYKALVQITAGRIFPLLKADKLGDYIVGTALETIETERLIGEFEQIIVNEVYENNNSIDAVTENLQQKMQERGSKINSINIENAYDETEDSKANVGIWQAATNIKSARGKLKQVSYQVPSDGLQWLDWETAHHAICSCSLPRSSFGQGTWKGPWPCDGCSPCDESTIRQYCSSSLVPGSGKFVLGKFMSDCLQVP